MVEYLREDGFVLTYLTQSFHFIAGNEGSRFDSPTNKENTNGHQTVEKRKMWQHEINNVKKANIKFEIKKYLLSEFSI